jgi:hypothetical protein
LVAVAACHGASAKAAPPSSGPVVDVKAACGALSELPRASDLLKGVDPSDPSASQAALARAISAYRAALFSFERVGPPSLRTRAEAVRAAVAARDFTRAATARATIDAWAVAHC